MFCVCCACVFVCVACNVLVLVRAYALMDAAYVDVHWVTSVLGNNMQPSIREILQ